MSKYFQVIIIQLNTYDDASLSVVSSRPSTFQMNTVPSAEPAANFVEFWLNATREKSQPTRKLSSLKLKKNNIKLIKIFFIKKFLGYELLTP